VSPRHLGASGSRGFSSIACRRAARHRPRHGVGRAAGGAALGLCPHFLVGDNGLLVAPHVREHDACRAARVSAPRVARRAVRWRGLRRMYCAAQRQSEVQGRRDAGSWAHGAAAGGVAPRFAAHSANGRALRPCVSSRRAISRRPCPQWSIPSDMYASASVGSIRIARANLRPHASAAAAPSDARRLMQRRKASPSLSRG
jgi:hypothetical protein